MWDRNDVRDSHRDRDDGWDRRAVEEDAPTLSREETAGIEAALESYRQGRAVDAKCAREIIDAALGR